MKTPSSRSTPSPDSAKRHTNNTDNTDNTNTSSINIILNTDTLLNRIWFFLKPPTWIGILQALNEQIPNAKDLLYNIILKTLLTDIIIPFLLLKISLSLSLSLSLPPWLSNGNLKEVASSTATTTVIPPLWVAMQPLHVLQMIVAARRNQQLIASLTQRQLQLQVQPELQPELQPQPQAYNTVPHPPPPLIQNRNIAMITILSPYVIHAITKRILPTLLIFTNRMKMWRVLRISPPKDSEDEHDNDNDNGNGNGNDNGGGAVQCLKKGIANNEIVRTKLCDIYFPPLSLTGTVNENTNENINENGTNENRTHSHSQPQRQPQRQRQEAILFLPGAFIDHTSYSQIAQSISKKGFLVVVVSFEPMRLAVEYFGANVRHMKKVMDLVYILWFERLRNGNNNNRTTSSTTNTNNTTTTKIRNGTDTHLLQWSIGGHSYGAYAAMRLSPKMKELLLVKSKPDDQTQNPDEKYNTNCSTINRHSHTCHYYKKQTKLKLIIWAAGNIDRLVPDLSTFDSDELEALVVLASNDAYCTFSLDDNLTSNDTSSGSLTLPSFLSRLPPDPKCTIINGGTHNNFASYDAPEEFNGVPDISRERQHQLIVDATTEFFLS